MSITRSYNKHTGRYYAYETTYEWDESQQKNVQKKRCIGQYDPDTDQIIPNGRRGRPRREDRPVGKASVSLPATDTSTNETLISAISDLSTRLKGIESKYSAMAEELHGLNKELSDLMKQIKKR